MANEIEMTLGDQDKSLKMTSVEKIGCCLLKIGMKVDLKLTDRHKRRPLRVYLSSLRRSRSGSGWWCRHGQPLTFSTCKPHLPLTSVTLTPPITQQAARSPWFECCRHCQGLDKDPLNRYFVSVTFSVQTASLSSVCLTPS